MRRKLILPVVLFVFMLVTVQGLAASSLLPFNSNWTVNDVSQLIASGAKVNEIDKNGLTPLMVASKNCTDAEVIRVLLDAGADVESRDKNNWIALMYAIRYNPNKSIAVLLIKRGSPTDVLLGSYTLAEYCHKNDFGEICWALGIEPFIFDKITGTITGHNYEMLERGVFIPSEIGGLVVTRIREGAFAGCNNLTSIFIPESVTSIEWRAFGGFQYEYGYDYCTKLERIHVDLRNAVYSSIDGILFSKERNELLFYPVGRDSSSYTVPDGVASIGNWAFDGSNLVSLRIPSSVINMGPKSFWNSGLKEINVDSSNASFSSNNGILLNKERTELIYYPAGRDDTSFTIPDGIIKIGEFAFDSCYNLTNIVIPDSVTSLGDYAFIDCRNIAYIDIPDGVTSIGFGAFMECQKLSSITIPDSVISIESEAFSLSRYDRLGLIYGVRGSHAEKYAEGVGIRFVAIDGFTLDVSSGQITGRISKEVSFTIPAMLRNDRVLGIGARAFSNNHSLENIVIEEGPVRIGEEAFLGCRNMVSITIPPSITEIAKSAFLGCDNLTVYCKTGSYAERFSKENGLLFIVNVEEPKG